MRAVVVFAALAVLLTHPEFARAHGGGLNSAGCHNERRTGGYHCHRSSYTPSAPSRARPAAAALSTRTLRSRTGSGSITYNRRDPVQKASKDLVLAAEALLRALGLDPGPVDGNIDSRTVQAIREFEANNALPISGGFRPELVPALAEAAATR